MGTLTLIVHHFHNDENFSILHLYAFPLSLCNLLCLQHNQTKIFTVNVFHVFIMIIVLSERTFIHTNKKIIKYVFIQTIFHYTGISFSIFSNFPTMRMFSLNQGIAHVFRKQTVCDATWKLKISSSTLSHLWYQLSKLIIGNVSCGSKNSSQWIVLCFCTHEYTTAKSFPQCTIAWLTGLSHVWFYKVTYSFWEKSIFH